jgi:hypothetical protein
MPPLPPPLSWLPLPITTLSNPLCIAVYLHFWMVIVLPFLLFSSPFFFEKANADCVTVVVAANVPTASIAAIKIAANARFRFVVVLFIIKSSHSFGILFVIFVCY